MLHSIVPHLCRFCIFILEHSCSITEMTTAASRASLNKMNIAVIEKRSPAAMVGDLLPSPLTKALCQSGSKFRNDSFLFFLLNSSCSDAFCSLQNLRNSASWCSQSFGRRLRHTSLECAKHEQCISDCDCSLAQIGKVAIKAKSRQWLSAMSVCPTTWWVSLASV